MLYLGLLVAIANAAPAIELGLSPYGAFDLADSNRETASWGPAFAVKLPVRWWFHSKVALRSQVDFGVRSGVDVVSWQDYANTFTLYTDKHSTRLRTRGMMFGPELKLFEQDIFELRGGVQVGGWRFTHTQTYLDNEPSPLRPLDTTVSGQLLESSDSIISAVTLLHISGQIAIGQSALSAELGYCVSDVDSNLLTGPDLKRNAMRAGYGLNEIQIGLGYNYLFGAKL